MKSEAQSAVEWMMTHSWAVIVILLVGLTFAHLGFFDAQARPRFEGLNAAGIQPMPSQVQLYSDGVLVLTVRNTRPYTMRYDWVDIAPIGDPSDKIRTYLGNLLKQGDVGSYLINGSNLAGGTAASLLILADTQGKTTYTDFHIIQQETHMVPGRDPNTKTIENAKGIQITTYDTPHGGGDCRLHRKCSCSEASDCPLSCQACSGGFCDNFLDCWDPGVLYKHCEPDDKCDYVSIKPCVTTDDCPLKNCQQCQYTVPEHGDCISICGVPDNCEYTEANPDGACQ